MGFLRCLSAVDTTMLQLNVQSNEMVFYIDQMNRKISSLKQNLELDKPSFDAGKLDVAVRYTFQSSDRYTDVTAQDLSKRWGISILIAVKILMKTTQKFLYSIFLLLSRRYKMDRVFSRKTLRGD